MPSETIEAVVLRHANYRERDRMLTLLTPDHGRLDLLSRGCRRPKSPLLAGSELFVRGEYVVFRTQERYTLTACTVADSFYPLRLDAYRLTCATYLLGLAQAAAQPEQPAAGLFSLLITALTHAAYCTQEPPLTVTNAFLLLYAAELGYRPRLRHCVACRAPLAPDSDARLDVEAGGLCCNACARAGQYPLTAAQIGWMNAVLANGYHAPMQAADALLFEALRHYVEHRLDGTIKAGKFLP